MNLKTVDIILPNYNKAKYLEECINSILNQSHKAWKLYIIDDNSQDNSKKILKNFEKIDSINIYKSKVIIILGHKINLFFQFILFPIIIGVHKSNIF